jgi:hypothetical protein
MELRLCSPTEATALSFLMATARTLVGGLGGSCSGRLASLLGVTHGAVCALDHRAEPQTLPAIAEDRSGLRDL